MTCSMVSFSTQNQVRTEGKIVDSTKDSFSNSKKCRQNP